MDEALALVSETAMGPICTSEDMTGLINGEERRLVSLRVNYNYHVCDAGNLPALVGDDGAAENESSTREL